MKKIILAVVACLSVFVVQSFSAAWTWSYSANDTDNRIQTAIDAYGTDAGVDFVAPGTAIDGSAITNLSPLNFPSRYPIVGKNATTLFAIESGSSTGTAVIIFTTPFTANPQIFVWPTVRAAVDVTSNATVIVAGTQSQTNFTTTFAAGTTFNWLAIGAK